MHMCRSFLLLVALPLAASPETAKAEIQMAAGASLATVQQTSTPPEFQPFARLGLRSTTTEYGLLLESRESIKKATVALPSMRIRHPQAELMAGYRWLPGPRSGFLRDSSALSSLPELPDGRQFLNVFARALPGIVWLPGVFALESPAGQDGGVYVAADSLLLAIGRQYAGLTVQETIPALASRIHLDVQRIQTLHERDGWRPDHEAYGRWRHVSETGRYLQLLGERRAYWDEVPERFARSGLVALHAGPAAWLQASAAGQDRGLYGFRLAGLAWLPEVYTKANRLTGQLVLRARYYERRGYESAEMFQSDTGGGLGLRLALAHNRGAVLLLGEARHSGSRSLEMGLSFGAGQQSAVYDPAGEPDEDVTTIPIQSRWRFDATLVWSRSAESTAGRDFLYLEGPALMEPARAAVRFFGEESAALVMRLRGYSLDVYLESRLKQATGQTTVFGRLQFVTRL